MCPDGDCPDNPVIGQVHNSPEFGELVFDGQTWSNENYNFLQSVSIEGTTMPKVNHDNSTINCHHTAVVTNGTPLTLHGDTFWGYNKSGDLGGLNGKRTGSQDINDWVIPSGGGANISIWSHKPTALDTNIPNLLQKYVASLSTGVSLGQTMEVQNVSPVPIPRDTLWQIQYIDKNNTWHWTRVNGSRAADSLMNIFENKGFNPKKDTLSILKY